jgi:phosphoribosylformimino-5-aminoimidazole carboxamide ribotide isomerase
VTLFRPCIDLHQGRVKQIVGKTLGESVDALETNFVAREGAAHFARLYQSDDLSGGHIIKLGPGNDEAALEALRVWPGHLQLGGGINPSNARYWLDSGASKVIVTSFLFEGAELS